ncbi:MAG: ribosome-recycling factor [Vicinamibacterales bacterium]
MVRIPLPALTEERRKELSRHVHKLSEEGRNQVRQARRDANDRLKKFLQGSRHLGRRREEGARRSPEAHRQLHREDRRFAEEEGRRPPRPLINRRT